MYNNLLRAIASDLRNPHNRIQYANATQLGVNDGRLAKLE